MVRSPLGDTEKRLLGCWGWLGKSKFCRKRNKQAISENMEPVQPGGMTKKVTTELTHTLCTLMTHRSDYYSYSMSNFIYHLVNQPHKLPNMYTVWWLGFIRILGPSQRLHCVMEATFAVGAMTTFLSASIPQQFWAALLPTETTSYELNVYWIEYNLS